MTIFNKDIPFEIYKYTDVETLKSVYICDKISYEILSSKHFWSQYFIYHKLPKITKCYNYPTDWIKYYTIVNTCTINTINIIKNIIINEEYMLKINLIDHEKLLINNPKIDRLIKSTVINKNLDDSMLSIYFSICFRKINLHYTFMFDKIDEDEDEYGYNERVELPLFIEIPQLKTFIFNALYNGIEIKLI